MNIKSIIAASVITGISVTAGIYGLQEYRLHQKEVEFAEAKVAYEEVKETAEKLRMRKMHECIDNQIDSMFEQNITDDYTVETTVQLFCGRIDSAAGMMGKIKMRAKLNEVE